jgi:ComF family protein
MIDSGKNSSKSRNLFGFLFGLVFPKACLGCGALGWWLCPDCSEARMEPVLKEVRYHLCEALDKIYHLADFDDPLIAKIVRTCKYHGVKELGELMGRQLGAALAAKPGLDGAIVVPVPLHGIRLRARGFNQAELIAREICLSVPDIRIEKTIGRQINSKPQAKLSRIERLGNLEGAFCLTSKESLADCRFAIIIDDVATTGTTMNEIAKILKSAGVKVVWGVAFAHGT